MALDIDQGGRPEPVHLTIFELLQLTIAVSSTMKTAISQMAPDGDVKRELKALSNLGTLRLHLNRCLTERTGRDMEEWIEYGEEMGC